MMARSLAGLVAAHACGGVLSATQNQFVVPQQFRGERFIEDAIAVRKSQRPEPFAADPHLCELEGGHNVFMPWKFGGERFGLYAASALESTLFNHPGSNVFVLNFELGIDAFDHYLEQGYCVISVPTVLDVLPDLFQRAAREIPGIEYDMVIPIGNNIHAFTEGAVVDQTGAMHQGMQFMIILLQLFYGGLLLPQEGLVLNHPEFMLPPGYDMMNTVVIFERLLEEEMIPLAINKQENEDSIFKRSAVDRGDDITILCSNCIHWIPKGSPYAVAVLSLIASTWGQTQGHEAEPFQNLDVFYTIAYKQFYADKRPEYDIEEPWGLPAGNGIEDILMIPYWGVLEPHMADSWKFWGMEADDSNPHNEIFTPRPQREASDWWTAMSAKLWLPFDYGPHWARNVVPNSIVDNALNHFMIQVSHRPYKTMYSDPYEPHDLSFRSPCDHILRHRGWVVDHHTFRECALPGKVGGYRTFRHLKVVGRIAPQKKARLVLTSDLPLQFFCRGVRSASEAHDDEVIGGKYRQYCNDFVSKTTPGKPLEFCGSPAEVNRAVDLLAYHPRQDPLVKLEGDLLHRSGVFTNMTVSLYQVDDCHADLVEQLLQSDTHVKRETMEALIEDVHKLITVVAHSAERCMLNRRMVKSFHAVYPGLPSHVTCECAEEDTTCPTEPEPHAHPTIPGLIEYRVPYDYGLARGKTLLGKTVETEFLLVLDDDFTRSFHSCLECMVLRMRSKWHNYLRPLDFVGFPVLEDERGFGAFRGGLRIVEQQLIVEPFVENVLPDGLQRVQICPMVFLARADRFKTFVFDLTLPVGEHEQFFFRNQHAGLQVGVTFDSSFPHYRVNVTSVNYAKRRLRQPDIMRDAWGSLGIMRVMYFFRKYVHSNMEDWDSLIEKGFAPWQVRNDDGLAKSNPPFEYFLMFVAVISGDANQRSALREPNSWLSQLVMTGAVQWSFFVPSVWNRSDLLAERDYYGDMVFAEGGKQGQTDSSTLRYVIRYVRNYAIKWLCVVQDDTFVHPTTLIQLMGAPPLGQGSPESTVIGKWSADGRGDYNGDYNSISSAVFVMTRDIVALLAYPEFSKRLRLFDTMDETLSSWLRPMELLKIPIPGMFTELPQGMCPLEAAFLSPVHQDVNAHLGEMHAANPGMPPCAELNATWGAAYLEYEKQMQQQEPQQPEGLGLNSLMQATMPQATFR